jgi:hypothetical protein
MNNVSLKPSTFVETYQGLLNMTAEQVIEKYKIREQKRRVREEKENESDVAISFTVTIAGLDLAFRPFLTGGVSLATITKSLSHKVDACYISLADEIKICRDRTDRILDKCNQHDLKDISELTRVYGFRLKNKYPVSTHTGKTSYRSIAWVRTRLGDIGRDIAANTNDLFLVGLAWCITTSALPAVISADTTVTLNDEIAHFRSYLKERIILLKAIDDIADVRISSLPGK